MQWCEHRNESTSFHIKHTYKSAIEKSYIYPCYCERENKERQEIVKRVPGGIPFELRRLAE